MVAGVVIALDGKAQGDIDITKFGGSPAMNEKRQAT
jgi:transcription-repair coupling factor (superfamily II helicase)